MKQMASFDFTATIPLGLFRRKPDFLIFTKSAHCPFPPVHANRIPLEQEVSFPLRQGDGSGIRRRALGGSLTYACGWLDDVPEGREVSPGRGVGRSGKVDEGNRRWGSRV